MPERADRLHTSWLRLLALAAVAILVAACSSAGAGEDAGAAD